MKEYSLKKTRRSFVEGLEFIDDDHMFLSSGSVGGFLDLVHVSDDDAEIELLSYAQIEPSFFGEGVTIVDDKTYMLTWRARKVLVFNTTELKNNQDNSTSHELQDLPEPLEQGWGLSHDSTGLLYMTP